MPGAAKSRWESSQHFHSLPNRISGGRFAAGEGKVKKGMGEQGRERGKEERKGN